MERRERLKIARFIKISETAAAKKRQPPYALHFCCTAKSTIDYEAPDPVLDTPVTALQLVWKLQVWIHSVTEDPSDAPVSLDDDNKTCDYVMPD